MIATELNLSELFQEAFFLFLALIVVTCTLYLGSRAFIKGLRDYFNRTDDHQKFTMR